MFNSKGKTKRMGDFKGGGRNTIEGGDYKLKAIDFKVASGKAGPYVVVDVMVIGPEHAVNLFGQHTELGFSIAAEGAARAWLKVLGVKEDDSVPVEIEEELEMFLKEKCIGAIFFATVTKGKDVATGKYDQNSVDAPWTNLLESEATPEDYERDA